jgi:ubiquitin fusion degradation protein 1
MMPGQERQDVERGGKIILPPSALEMLTRLHIQYPMLFKLTNSKHHRVTHSGVLEFVADEGRVYLPYWMMSNLLLEEGSIVQIENVSLPVASFAKFQPQSPDFLDITNPKAVLENALRKFACLTTGDMIAINYNDRIYELRVLETKPSTAVSIIECDMNVDFAVPVGYKEPEPIQKPVEDDEPMAVDVSEYTASSTFHAFSGQGNRLDGKNKPTTSAPNVIRPQDIKRGIPNYGYQKGKITFIRATRQLATDTEKENNKDLSQFTAFGGEGHSLRKKTQPPLAKPK